MTWKAYITIIIIIITSFIIFIIIFIIVIVIRPMELSICESHSPVEQQRSAHPGGGSGVAHCQPGQPGLTLPYHQPQLEWSSQTPPGLHCHSSSPVSHMVHRKQWERPIESNVQCPAHSAVVASHAYNFQPQLLYQD